MARERNKNYLEWIESVFTRDERKCTICSSTKKLNAHHVVPWDESIVLRFEVSNGLTLCHICHVKHHDNFKDKRSHIPWNKGMKGLNIGTKKGTKFTDSHKEKISLSKVGKSTWNKDIKGSESHMFGKVMPFRGKKWIVDPDTKKRKWID